MQVYRIPYYLCLVSAVLYNPDDKENCSGMMLQLVEPGVSKPFEIRSHDIVHWRQMYHDLTLGKFDPYEKLEFSKYRRAVMTE